MSWRDIAVVLLGLVLGWAAWAWLADILAWLHGEAVYPTLAQVRELERE